MNLQAEDHGLGFGVEGLGSGVEGVGSFRVFGVVEAFT